MLMRELFDSSVLYSFFPYPPRREIRIYESGRPTRSRREEVPYTSQVRQSDGGLCKLSLLDFRTQLHRSLFPSLKSLLFCLVSSTALSNTDCFIVHYKTLRGVQAG